ncbi:MAG: 3-oxoacyl-ACP reductase FabG [Saprospiraceae bacterium]|nr:3-oxoacyl-ACP reductase FabG [Saprospiraceae bacterium]
MKCALITGGSKGIGRAIAKQIALDHGLHTLINYSTDIKSANETCNMIKECGGSAEVLKFKVQNKDEVDQVISDWQTSNPDKFIHVLVNNAGITKDGLFIFMSEINWDEVIEVSLKGMFNLTQNVMRKMLHYKTGKIINIVSISGLKGTPGQTNYSAAKAGMIGATKALAQEVAKMGITVNAVAPGLINTDMIKSINVENYLKIIPAGRVGEPEEIAHLVSFLCSEKASYITGEVININGGLYS